MKPSFPAMIWVWLALVGVASFLTWGTIRPTSFSGFPGGFPGDFGNSILGGIVISVTAWTGNLTLAGLSLPNWLPVIAAAGAVAIVYARGAGAQLSPLAPTLLLIYALAHVVLFGLIIVGSGRGSLGIGTIAMFAALIGLWRALASALRPQAPQQSVESA